MFQSTPVTGQHDAEGPIPSPPDHPSEEAINYKGEIVTHRVSSPRYGIHGNYPTVGLASPQESREFPSETSWERLSCFATPCSTTNTCPRLYSTAQPPWKP
jgi:hypothetical protein